MAQEAHAGTGGNRQARCRAVRPAVVFASRLFGEIVLDFWRDRRAVAGEQTRALQGRIDLLRGRERILEDAFVFERRIDGETYERQRDKLREDIALLQIEAEDAAIEEIDIEGVVAEDFWRTRGCGVPRRTRRSVRGAGARLVRRVTSEMDDLQAQHVLERIEVAIAVQQ
jgi:hypothetical protein